MYATVEPDLAELRVIETTATTISLAWTLSEVTYIDRFEIVYNHTVKRCNISEGVDKINNITSDTINMYILSGLNEDSKYRITVRAVNDAGSSMTSISADTNTSSN